MYIIGSLASVLRATFILLFYVLSSSSWKMKPSAYSVSLLALVVTAAWNKSRVTTLQLGARDDGGRLSLRDLCAIQSYGNLRGALISRVHVRGPSVVRATQSGKDRKEGICAVPVEQTSAKNEDSKKIVKIRGTAQRST